MESLALSSLKLQKVYYTVPVEYTTVPHNVPEVARFTEKVAMTITVNHTE